MTASDTLERERLDPDTLPVRADSARELADDLRWRLVAPDDRTPRVTALWLMPSMAVTGILVALGDGPIGAAVAALCILVVVVWRLPHFASYVIIADAPWMVGFARDQVLPLLRVNEAFLAVLLLVLAERWLFYPRRVVIRLRSFDYVMLAFVAFGFLLPLIAQFVRLKRLGFDDIQYTAVFMLLGLLDRVGSSLAVLVWGSTPFPHLVCPDHCRAGGSAAECYAREPVLWPQLEIGQAGPGGDSGAECTGRRG